MSFDSLHDRENGEESRLPTAIDRLMDMLAIDR